MGHPPLEKRECAGHKKDFDKSCQPLAAPLGQTDQLASKTQLLQSVGDWLVGHFPSEDHQIGWAEPPYKAPLESPMKSSALFSNKSKTRANAR